MSFIRKLFKADIYFFQENERREGLFYPWAYPGEAFIIDLAQKKQIIIFMYSLLSLLFISVAGVIIAHREKIITSEALFYSGGIVSMFLPLLYIASMYGFKKNKHFYLSKTEDRIKKNVLLAWICIVYFQALFIWTIVRSDNSLPLDGIVVTLSGVYTIAISCFFWCLQKSRGYYFSDNKKSL